MCDLMTRPSTNVRRAMSLDKPSNDSNLKSSVAMTVNLVLVMFLCFTQEYRRGGGG